MFKRKGNNSHRACTPKPCSFNEIERVQKVKSRTRRRQKCSAEKIESGIKDQQRDTGAFRLDPQDQRSLMSFDTSRTTPRISKRVGHRWHGNRRVFPRSERLVSHTIKEDYVLPCSIDVLNLVLPQNGENMVTMKESNEKIDDWVSSVVTVSDAFEDDTTIASMMSGQTALAKDRVHETISSTIDIDSCFLSSPRSVNSFQNQQEDLPVNVDFVLESSENELALFAKSCIRLGKYHDVIDFYDTILDHNKKKYGKDHRLVISTLHNLGIVHTWNGDYKKALAYCNAALKLRRKKFGNAHRDVVSSLCELGILFYAREDFNKGLDALREALQIQSKIFSFNGSKDRISSILNNIACLHFSMGKLTASLSTFEESLTLRRKTMGSAMGTDVNRTLFNISVTLTNASTVAAKQGDIARAASLMEEGLIVQLSVLPEDNRIVVAAKEALSNIEATEKKKCKVGGKDVKIDPKVSPSDGKQEVRNLCCTMKYKQNQSGEIELPCDLNLICIDMLSLGSPEKKSNSSERVKDNMNTSRLSQALLEEGRSKSHCSWVDTSKKVKNADHLNFSHLCQNAASFVERGETKKAIEVFESVRRSHKTKCGDVEYILSTLIYMVGLICLYTSDYDGALANFRDSTKLRSSVLDSSHKDVLASHSMLAITMFAMKDFDGAQRRLEKVLRLTRKKYGYSHEKVAIVLNNIGLCHYEQGGLLTASKFFEETVEILREGLNSQPIHTTTSFVKSVMLGRSLNNLAFIRQKRKQYSDAIVALEEVLKINRRIFNKDNKILKDSVQSLGACMAIANCQENKGKLAHITTLYTKMLDA